MVRLPSSIYGNRQMTLRDFLEAELENRQSSGGSETDYVNEAEGALAEFDALRAELDQAAGVIVDRNREIADLIADLDTAKSNTGEACARIAALAKALEPFAEVADGMGWDKLQSEELVHVIGPRLSAGCYIEAGTFRRARAVLNPEDA